MKPNTDMINDYEYARSIESKISNLTSDQSDDYIIDDLKLDQNELKAIDSILYDDRQRYHHNNEFLQSFEKKINHKYFTNHQKSHWIDTLTSNSKSVYYGSLAAVGILLAAWIINQYNQKTIKKTVETEIVNSPNITLDHSKKSKENISNLTSQTTSELNVATNISSNIENNGTIKDITQSKPTLTSTLNKKQLTNQTLDNNQLNHLSIANHENSLNNELESLLKEINQNINSKSEIQNLELYLKLGIINLKLKNVSTAYQSFQTSLSMADKYKVYELVVKSYGWLGNLEKERNNDGSAEIYYDKAVEIGKKYGLDYNLWINERDLLKNK